MRGRGKAAPHPPVGTFLRGTGEGSLVGAPFLAAEHYDAIRQGAALADADQVRPCAASGCVFPRYAIQKNTAVIRFPAMSSSPQYALALCTMLAL